ncbi:MAG: hypothetical protein H3C34_03025 [Caldilineaceae bacterium]|nr:hypothetical protein [Caldilineaceae bacterium]
MRIPYIVGRWVSDRHYYGRHRLFVYLLNTEDAATWVVGARRMGKTSLLRQLEFLADGAHQELVPLFWDMQGCENSGDLSTELYMSLEDVTPRFAQLGIEVESYEGLDALVLLRRLSRELANRGKRLLLLIDEAEVLIGVAHNEPAWLARLRRTLQDPIQKTVMASTKLLAQLNDVTGSWDTSPFLFGFNMVNLWSLDVESAISLIRQSQTEPHVTVDPVVLEDVLLHTNRHPYLIQFLCQRLCIPDRAGHPMLRPPDDEDLEPDHLLAGFFLIDFQHLTKLERRLLLTIARETIMTEQELLVALADESPKRIRTFLWGMDKLGHLRQVYGQWAIGNEFLRRWLLQEWSRLQRMNEFTLEDESFEELLRVGHQRESHNFAEEVERLERDYAALKALERLCDPAASPEIKQEVARVGQLLDLARRDLSGSFLARWPE